MNRSIVISKRVIVILIISTLIMVSPNMSTTVFKSAMEDYKTSKPFNLGLGTHDPIEIISDDNFTDYGFDGIGSDVDPYIIEGYNITTTSDYGIVIKYTTMYFVIRNCYIDAEEYCIFITNVAEETATIKNNTCTHNLRGIYLNDSSGSTLTNNTCTNNNVGIHLDSSSDCILTNNTCTNSFSGIYLISSSDCILTNNTCTINSFGISLHSSSSSDLINNTCINNYQGIILHSSGSSLITNNLLQENDEYGIYIALHSNNNEIHHNIFVDNNLGGTSQAYDEGENNIWYDSTINEGNWWSDWSGSGSYSIDGPAGSVDPYPLDEEGNPPVVSEFLQISTITMTLFLCLALIPLLLKRKRKIN
ncbi:MAG: NosD domain-containing protein [Candidatus Thorarchaeota archaeon]